MKIKFRADSKIKLSYLRHIFGASPGEDVRVSLTEDFGRMAISLYTPCERKDLSPDDELTVCLRLPRHNTIAGTTKRVRYTKGAQRRLNLILEARLNTDLNTFYARGIAAGIPKKEIIEAFILERGLILLDCQEMLSKRAYRANVETLATITRKILEKARYNQRKIASQRLAEE